MTEEYTIQAADNGMLVSTDEWVGVIENTHVDKGTGNENLIKELGKIFHDAILHTMNTEWTNIVRVKIEIDKVE
jgi:hypothetical protein